MSAPHPYQVMLQMSRAERQDNALLFWVLVVPAFTLVSLFGLSALWGEVKEEFVQRDAATVASVVAGEAQARGRVPVSDAPAAGDFDVTTLGALFQERGVHSDVSFAGDRHVVVVSYEGKRVNVTLPQTPGGQASVGSTY